ncbi:MAG: precorrin-3B C(17)-methyltransferase [Eubacterium sp.]|jgi:precorrin-3B C17-methyltransferase|nr:precorrin-3B C(17)-methyltransferase [Eubacterium sp.]
MKLYVVGIGPGNVGKMTREAYDILNSAEIIVGYPVYNELVRPYFPNKKYLESSMRHETKRVKMALEAAQSGKKTAIICSGDSGVYGMAGLALELAIRYPGVDIEIIPGVSAAFGGAAVLGAPLGHDFAVISLSDLLTPWDVIEKRIYHTAAADMAICFYNPLSKRRAGHLLKACDILLGLISPETVCGYVRNIARTGQKSEILSLSELKTRSLDMFVTVFIGNSKTKVIGGKMVTPRGYICG